MRQQYSSVWIHPEECDSSASSVALAAAAAATIPTTGTVCISTPTNFDIPPPLAFVVGEISSSSSLIVSLACSFCRRVAKLLCAVQVLLWGRVSMVLWMISTFTQITQSTSILRVITSIRCTYFSLPTNFAWHTVGSYSNIVLGVHRKRWAVFTQKCKVSLALAILNRKARPHWPL